jgi:O-antigen ligase
MFFERLTQALSTGGERRVDIWRAGLEACKHHAFIGAGFANFEVVYSAFAGYAPHFSGFARDAHNVFLAVATELGLVGLVLFGMALFYTIRDATSTRRSLMVPSALLVSCEAAYWAILVSSLFANILIFKAFWLSFILLGLVSRSEQELSAMRRQDRRYLKVELSNVSGEN